MSSPEFESRLSDYLDGDLDEAGRKALRQEIERDPAAQSEFEAAMRLESLLSAAHIPEATEDRILSGLARRLDEGKVVRGVVFRWWPAAVAAAAAVVLAVVWQNWPASLPTGAHEVLSGVIQVNGQPARRIANGAEWTVVGLEPGVVRLTDGSLAEFAPGTVATLRGPQDGFRQTVALASGAGRFHVERGARQFRVWTPLGQVTVLGTEFSVALRPTDEIEAMQNNEILNAPHETMKLNTPTMLALAVAVTVGQVQVDIGGKTYTLAAGQTAYAKEGERKAVREMTGELTKLDRQSLTVTTYKEGEPRHETFKLTDGIKVALETAEMEPIQGKEGKSRPKTIEGKAGELKVGQRVRVQYDGGVASRVLVLQVRAPAKSREGEREKGSAPEAKPRKGGEGEREREQAPAPKEGKAGKEGREGGERNKG